MTENKEKNITLDELVSVCDFLDEYCKLSKSNSDKKDKTLGLYTRISLFLASVILGVSLLNLWFHTNFIFITSILIVFSLSFVITSIYFNLKLKNIKENKNYLDLDKITKNFLKEENANKNAKILNKDIASLLINETKYAINDLYNRVDYYNNKLNLLARSNKYLRTKLKVNNKNISRILKFVKKILKLLTKNHTVEDINKGNSLKENVKDNNGKTANRLLDIFIKVLNTITDFLKPAKGVAKGKGIAASGVEVGSDTGGKTIKDVDSNGMSVKGNHFISSEEDNLEGGKTQTKNKNYDGINNQEPTGNINESYSNKKGFNQENNYSNDFSDIKHNKNHEIFESNIKQAGQGLAQLEKEIIEVINNYSAGLGSSAEPRKVDNIPDKKDLSKNNNEEIIGNEDKKTEQRPEENKQKLGENNNNPESIITKNIGDKEKETKTEEEGVDLNNIEDSERQKEKNEQIKSVQEESSLCEANGARQRVLARRTAAARKKQSENQGKQQPDLDGALNSLDRTDVAKTKVSESGLPNSALERLAANRVNKGKATSVQNGCSMGK